MFSAVFPQYDTQTQPSLLPGHDVSDGGILVAFLEMAFAGDRGLSLDLPLVAGCGVIASLFAEEVAVAVEVSPDKVDSVMSAMELTGVLCLHVGTIVAYYLSPPAYYLLHVARHMPPYWH